MAVLTDIDADRHYLSVLTFSESVAISPTKSDDGDPEEDSALTIHSLMYSPKCLVLVSRLDYFETFKVRRLNLCSKNMSLKCKEEFVLMFHLSMGNKSRVYSKKVKFFSQNNI